MDESARFVGVKSAIVAMVPSESLEVVPNVISPQIFVELSPAITKSDSKKGRAATHAKPKTAIRQQRNLGVLLFMVFGFKR